MCYTYDGLDRVTKRTEKDLNGAVLSEETFSYDKASNLTNANGTAFTYGTGNRLTLYNGHTVSYDLDGNMLSDGSMVYEYDSANRLIKAGDNEYTYNAEDVRIRNLCGEYDTTYVYDTNVKLSRLLQKTTNGVTTKYVYGLGLIGQEKEYCFRTYHFDYRGSTVAITDMYGNVTDRFEYDTYGKVISHTGNSFVVFGFNGRDGVVTDKNGLLYMRARYYSPDLRRFVNADVIHGEISNSVTLNRYAYANGNPSMNIDPLGLSAAKWRMQEKKHQRTERKVTPEATAPTTLADPSYAKLSLDEEKFQEQWENTQKTAEQTQSATQEKSNFRKQLTAVANSVDEFCQNTFGAGVVLAQKYEDFSEDTLFGGYETGKSTTAVVSGDVSKPISVYLEKPLDSSHWWEYEFGAQMNIRNGGVSVQFGLIERGFTISSENSSVEGIIGLNKVGYTYRTDVDFGNRVSSGPYHHAYIRTLPTLGAVAAVASAAYFGTAMLATAGTAVVSAVIDWLSNLARPLLV